MSEYGDQVARELLALTEPDQLRPDIDRSKVREMLADAWDVGHGAAGDRNPFRPKAEMTRR